jgi:hypothetical protein
VRTELYAREDWLRCRSVESFDRYFQMQVAGDERAAERMMSEYRLKGECGLWPKDMRVRHEDSRRLGGPTVINLVCYAEFGGTSPCHWTMSEAIEEREADRRPEVQP